jgi:hypothetical protein
MKSRIVTALGLSLATLGASFVMTLTPADGSSPAPSLALQLLNIAVIPPGAVLAHPNSSDAICQCAGTPIVQPFASEHRYYVVPGTPATIEKYLTTHIPKGGSYDGSAGTSTSGNSAPIDSITVTFSANGPHVYLKQLAYSLTRKTSTTSWLRVDGQIVWVPSRSASQKIPAARSATVTGYEKTALSGTSDPEIIQLSGKKLAKVVAELNALPLGPENRCMENLSGFTISLRLKDGTRLQINNGFCAGAFDSVSKITGKESGIDYTLSDPSCHFIDDVVALFTTTPVKGTHEALSGCQSWSKTNHTT